MKKHIFIAVLLTVLAQTTFAYQIMYRVQVGSYERDEVPTDIRKVPEMKKYLLPEAKYTFFSGGYFFFFRGAEMQLEKVQELGFKKAEIRVFKDNKLLDRIEGQKFIDKEIYNPTPISHKEDVNKQIYSIDSKNTLENRMILFKEMINPVEEEAPKAPSDSLNLDLDVSWKNKIKLPDFNLGFLNKKEKKTEEVISINDKSEETSTPEIKEKNDNRSIDGRMESAKEDQKESTIKETASAEAKELQTTQTASQPETEKIATDSVAINPEDLELLQAIEEALVEEEAEEIIEESDKIELADNFKVTDIPYFKIYLISNKANEKSPRILNNLETPVSPYRQRDMMMYTVGYYETSAEAEADLRMYHENGFINAKIVAYYKGIIISRSMGDEILVLAAQQKN